MALPDHFCWTRFGTEAGQTAQRILYRKEQERVANNGIFLWGIGNSVGPGIKELVRSCNLPEVLFSPIKSPPRVVDVSPGCTVAWTLGQTNDGTDFRLPPLTLVTSRLDVSSPKKTHYALVCFSSTGLFPSTSPPQLHFGALRNFVSGNPIGASQVTAVVTRDRAPRSKGSVYDVALRAHLVPPFFIRLREPIALNESSGAIDDWCSIGRWIWNKRGCQCETRTRGGEQSILPLYARPGTVVA
jgi:hypothetical protein